MYSIANNHKNKSTQFIMYKTTIKNLITLTPVKFFMSLQITHVRKSFPTRLAQIRLFTSMCPSVSV